MYSSENIVQIEFFAPLPDSSLQEVLSSALARGLEGDRIKTVVRIPDRGGKLTRAIKKLAKVSQIPDRTQSSEGFFEGSIPSLKNSLVLLWIFIWEPFRRSKARKRLQRHLLMLGKKSLRDALLLRQDSVFVETEGWAFRPVQDNEVHELAERVSFCPNAWYFVFAPGEMTSHSPGKTVCSSL